MRYRALCPVSVLRVTPGFRHVATLPVPTQPSAHNLKQGGVQVLSIDGTVIGISLLAVDQFCSIFLADKHVLYQCYSELHSNTVTMTPPVRHVGREDTPLNAPLSTTHTLHCSPVLETSVRFLGNMFRPPCPL